jgi:hypothetical protein
MGVLQLGHSACHIWGLRFLKEPVKRGLTYARKTQLQEYASVIFATYVGNSSKSLG